MSRTLVVDASVAAKWLLPEPDSDAAARLLEERGIVFHVPELFDAELGNALWKRVQRREIDADEASALVALVSRIPATRHRHDALLEGALAIALKLSITVYDALYVALAIALNARLVTSDRWLAERASRAVEVESPGEGQIKRP
jgi:predicted nucleic acid-binding protein